MGFGEWLGSITQAAGDAVEGAVEAVTETVTDVVDTVCDVATDVVDAVADTADNVLGPIVSAPITFVAGAINGALDGVRQLVDNYVKTVFTDVASILGDLLRGNFTGFLNNLGNLVIDGFLFLVVFV